MSYLLVYFLTIGGHESAEIMSRHGSLAECDTEKRELLRHKAFSIGRLECLIPDSI